MKRDDINIFDGKLHYLNGLNFYYSKKETRFTFYVDSVPVNKRRRARIDMFKELNHARPHVHVDEHEASFAIDDGSLLCGECDNKTTKKVQDWIEKHRDALMELWTALNEGANPVVYEEIRDRLSTEAD